MDASGAGTKGPRSGDLRMRLPPWGFRGRPLDFVPLSQAIDAVIERENLGYGAVWLPEMAGRDVFAHLMALLSAIRRLVGATGVGSIWARDPIALSCGAKTLTEAFPERVLIALGVSHKNLVDGVRGHVYEKPIAALTRHLDAIDGAPFRAERPTTPVRWMIGALGPAMLRLAAARTDGARPYLVPVKHTAWAREVLGPDALLWPDQMVVLETGARVARDIARARIGVYLTQPHYVANLRRFGFTEDDLVRGGSDRLVDALVAHGTVDEVIARLRAHLRAGADHVSIQPLTRGPREATDAPVAGTRTFSPRAQLPAASSPSRCCLTTPN